MHATLALLPRAFARLVLGLAALVLGLAAPLAALAQSCTGDPKPYVFLRLPTITTDNITNLSPGFARTVGYTVFTELSRALAGGVKVVYEEDFVGALERTRVEQLLGSDAVGSSTLLNEVVPQSALDWIVLVSLRPTATGHQREMSLTLFDSTRRNRFDRSRLATLPSAEALVGPFVAAEVRAFAQGLSCSLRLQRGAPAQPQLRLAVEPRPPRGQPGDTLTVRATLVDLANNSAPVPNQRISVRYLTPQGRRESRFANTDANGVATDRWVLGEAHPRAGLIEAVFVDLHGLERKSQQINYYVQAAGGKLNLTTGKAQMAPAGGDTLNVELRHNNAPVAATAVNLTASAGAVGSGAGGASASVITSSAGLAAVPYVAPNLPSVADVRATTTLPAGAGTAEARVSYVVDPGVVMGFKAGGDTVIFGASSLRVDLEREQQAVTGVTVEFSLVGGGSLSSAAATTDSVGRAEALFSAPSRAGTSTITARVTLDGQTYTRSVTVRYSDPLDAITREIADVKEAIYLDPSDASLIRLDRLRGILLARGETSRAEALLNDPLVSGQLYCTHQRAHDECGAGLRAKAESTLRLLKSVSNGSTVVSTVFDRASESLLRCPYPLFINETLYVENANIHDINVPGAPTRDYPAYAYLAMSWNADGSVKNLSWDVQDRNEPRRRAYGHLPLNASGSNFSSRASVGDVQGLYGNYFMASLYQAGAAGSTASFSVSPTAVSGRVFLYEVSFDNVPQLADVSFSINATLPQPPDAAMCRHASLPVAEPGRAPARRPTWR